jgi:IS30 family transposase
MPGRPKALDDDKCSTICSLVATGVSLRQAAHYLGCTPTSIRREAKRNAEFRERLNKAKAEARIQPLETLQQAAKSNWRAALAWMERLDPDRFANPSESIVTKREANRFVDDLIESIEDVVKNPRQRRDLFDRLEAALPLAMERRWHGDSINRAVDQIKDDIQERNRLRSSRISHLKSERDRRRIKLYDEIAKYLPQSMLSKLWGQRELLDPKEVFAEHRSESDRPETANRPTGSE